MRIAIYSTKAYTRDYFAPRQAEHGHQLTFLEPRLVVETAGLATGHEAVCVFVNDCVDAEVIARLAEVGVRVIALRCSGFNNVDLAAAGRSGMTVVRVPAYSPHAVAEHAMALILALNRKTHRAFNRVREGNFALEGLVGFDLCGRTAGVVGTGRIGQVMIHILRGFGCEVLAFDPFPTDEATRLGATYVDLDQLFGRSHIITLHCPLTPETHHLVDAAAITRMQPGVMLINTSRGALVDTPAVIDGLKSGVVGHLGLDVYEEEADLFFENLSDTVLQDDVFARLLTFPNVLITGHQAFFTADALQTIADTTLANVAQIEAGRACGNEVTFEKFRG